MNVQHESPETLEKLSDLNLSVEEITTYRRKFNTIDLNKDGKITLRELFTISRVFGYKFTVDELKVTRDAIQLNFELASASHNCH